MEVNRSGYYKWKKRQGTKNQYELDRITLIELLQIEHKKHPSYGYHRLASVIRKGTGWIFSDNLANKCCKFANIKSKARHYKYKKLDMNMLNTKISYMEIGTQKGLLKL